MFDYIIAKNNLMKFFEQVDLHEIDIIFVKELIFSDVSSQESTQVSS